MIEYIPIKINISDGQRDKILKAIQNGTGVSIGLKYEDLNGEHVIVTTKTQAYKLANAYQEHKGVTLKLTKTQLEHNKTIEGGFITAILPLLATAGKFLASSVLPSLAQGALAGVGAATASKVVDKIAGSGVVYLKKGGQSYKIVQQGNGLWLRPASEYKMQPLSDGL